MDDTEYQRQIIDTFINAIYVYDDKLVFTYNFKDGTETVPLKAVEDAFGSDLTQVAPPNPRNPNIIPIGDGFGFLFLSQVLWCDKQNERKETDRNHSDSPGTENNDRASVHIHRM